VHLVPALLAGLFTGWTTASLPFYPGGGAVALALVAALLTAFSARGGLAFALVVPIFPLGNISLGLALLYAAIAIVWFALNAREPGAGLAFVVGPLLAPIAALPLLPLLLQPVRTTWRRALAAGTGVLTSTIVAGVAGAPLPFDEGRARPLGIEAESNAIAAADALRHAISDHPALLLEALVLAVAAAALPLAHRRGLWPVVGFGAALIASTVLVAPHANPLPAVLCAWGTCGALALWQVRAAWLPRPRPVVAGARTN
jgi:hypothetical protein